VISSTCLALEADNLASDCDTSAVLLLQEREDQVAAREANLKSTREAVAAQQGAAQVQRSSSDDTHKHTVTSKLAHADGALLGTHAWRAGTAWSPAVKQLAVL
jgi:hypothetical protein